MINITSRSLCRLRIPTVHPRTQCLPFQGQTSLRKFASKESNPEPANTPHTPDTYDKEGSSVDPSSSKTYVVDGSETKTQRPFDSPAGAYATTDPSQPYDEPASDKNGGGHVKQRYGNMNRNGNTKDVDGSGGPLDSGKEGRH